MEWLGLQRRRRQLCTPLAQSSNDARVAIAKDQFGQEAVSEGKDTAGERNDDSRAALHSPDRM